MLGEWDEALRRRIRQRIMGFSNAGGADLYRYWALTASPEIADVAVDSPQPGHVRISVLSRLNDGVASTVLIDAVKAVVMRDDIRVLTDTVHVLPAEIVPGLAILRAESPDYPESAMSIDDLSKIVTGRLVWALLTF